MQEETARNLMAYIREHLRSEVRHADMVFVDPGHSFLSEVVSNAHILVMGRRGSGKTTLMAKALHEIGTDGAPAAWLDVEPYKHLAWPDILIQSLLEVFAQLSDWCTEQMQRSSPLRLINRRDRQRLKQLRATSKKLQGIAKELERLLNTPAEVAVTSQTELAAEQADATRTEAGLHVDVAGLTGETTSSARRLEREATEKRFREMKTDTSLKSLPHYHVLLSEMGNYGNGRAAIFVDDFYFVALPDQHQVIDYLFNAVKNTGVWLKVATIKHRSNLYRERGRPVGVRPVHDIQPVELDRTLESPAQTLEFLRGILLEVVRSVNGGEENLATDAALQRLVLSSGGVPRDFLYLLRGSLHHWLRPRGRRSGTRVGVREVNLAINDLAEYKRLDDDARGDAVLLRTELDRLVRFCLDEHKVNCFLVDRANAEVNPVSYDAIKQLMDLRFIHIVASAFTRREAGTKHEGYLLDYSQYTGPHLRRGIGEFPFWKYNEYDRRNRIRLQPVYPLDDTKTGEELGEAAARRPAVSRKRRHAPPEDQATLDLGS